MIRITGGKNRSRKLFIPENNLTKPTMDKVRAAVFNALSNEVNGKDVLDLFSGSGSYGFESLSRDAKSVTFVDKEKDAIKAIKNNAEALKETSIKVFQNDVITFLESKNGQFDLVFVDPPYKLDIYQNVLNLLEKNEYLKDNSIIVLESEKELDINLEKYKKVKLYNYGLAKIYILRK